MDTECKCQGSFWRPGKAEGREAELLKSLLAGMDHPDDKIREVVAGDKFCAVKTTRGVGLSSLLHSRPGPKEEGLAERLLGKSLREAAGLLFEEEPFSVCLGLAALNTSFEPKLNAGNRPAEKLIADLGREREVALVGDFPFSSDLAGKVGELHLFELQERPGALPRDRWEEILERVSVLAVTGTALLTRHMAYFLDHARNATRIVIGPTTCFSPVMFDWGAHVLAGSIVAEPEPVLEGIAEGLSFSRLKRQKGGIKFGSMAAPGFDGLG